MLDLNKPQRLCLLVGGLLVILLGAFNYSAAWDEPVMALQSRPAIPIFLGTILIAMGLSEPLRIGFLKFLKNDSKEQQKYDTNIRTPNEFLKSNDIQISLDIEQIVFRAKEKIFQKLIRTYNKSELHIDYIYLATYSMIFFSFHRAISSDKISYMMVEGWYLEMKKLSRRDEPFLPEEEFDRIVWYVNQKSVNRSLAGQVTAAIFSIELGGVIGRSPIFSKKMKSVCEQFKDIYIEEQLKIIQGQAQ